LIELCEAKKYRKIPRLSFIHTTTPHKKIRVTQFRIKKNLLFPSTIFKLASRLDYDLRKKYGLLWDEYERELVYDAGRN
jgi:hypothetical protein